MNDPATAPRDGTQFLADFGWPWLVAACWSDAMQQFVYAALAANLYEGKNDPAYETEWANDSELEGWLPLPDGEGD